MINRTLKLKIIGQIDKFPVIAITGPRQSGKTTLAKEILKDFDYYNLEDLSTKRLAINDPVGFINSMKRPAIIDEIQKVPDLLSQIQVAVDESKTTGKFIITGSESISLSDKISQSLAGRVVINTLLPLSYAELTQSRHADLDIDSQILKGFYPRIYSTNQERDDFYPEYITTYIEKDVRQIQNIGNLAQFEKFLQILAGRVGQLLNLSSLSNDLGVSITTVENWISILEASFIAYRLQPFHFNTNKRLVKSPKIYFYDTGVLTTLLGISTKDELKRHFAYGSIFENFVINEIQKKIFNNKLKSKLLFYRDSNGVEVDLVIDQGVKMTGIEIKSSQTFSSDFTKGLLNLKNILLQKNYDFDGKVIYGGNQNQAVGNFELTTFKKLSETF